MKPFGQRITAIFVFDTLELGGAERQGLLLARYLQERCDVSVQVWGLTGRPGRLATLCESHAIPWRAVDFTWRRELVGAPSNLIALHHLARELRAQRPDLLLPYTYFSNVIAGLVWRRTGARVCVWNQRDAGLYLGGIDPWRSTATRLVRDFVANSRQGSVALRAVTSRSVTVVNNGVELEAPREDRGQWRRRLGVSSDAFVASMVANLHAHKDHATLLRAWRRFLDMARPESAVLVLAGRIEETGAATRALVAELALNETVRFLGPVDDVSGLYHAIDLYVHCSTTEGFPNAVVEAMAAGCPVVATDLPGIREAVGPDGARFLVPALRPAEVATLIMGFYEDPALRARTGKTAAKRIHDDLSATRMCETMVGYLARTWRRDE